MARRRRVIGVPYVRVTRKEHNCGKCGALIKTGSRVYGVTFEVPYKGLKIETRCYSRYYCLACKPVVEAKV